MAQTQDEYQADSSSKKKQKTSGPDIVGKKRMNLIQPCNKWKRSELFWKRFFFNVNYKCLHVKGLYCIFFVRIDFYSIYTLFITIFIISAM